MVLSGFDQTRVIDITCVRPPMEVGHSAVTVDLFLPARDRLDGRRLETRSREKPCAWPSRAHRSFVNDFLSIGAAQRLRC